MKTRNDKLSLYDIVECCEKIRGHVLDKTVEDFKATPMLQDALVRNIEIIGEAAKNISEDLMKRNAQISWSEIARMRDKVIHHYFRINLDIVWQTVTIDIPKLKSEVEKILISLSDRPQ